MPFCSAHGWPCSNKSDPKQPGVPASPDIDASRILKSIPTRCGADCLESSTEYLSEGCTTTSTSIPCRHPYFWDHWGNVIVQVGCVVYRLHGPNLARHSQVFADILCNQPKYIANGVPFHCAILAGVNTTDFEILLDALENPFAHHVHPLTFDAVTSLLRVSTTLKFSQFREVAIHYLEEAWPSALDDFDVTSKWLEHSAEIVTLAREYSVPSILKRALYELLRTPGFTKNPSDDISKSDLILLSRARERVSDAWLAAVVIPDSKPCVQSLQSCTGIQQRQLFSVEGLREYRNDPMCGLPYAIDILVAASRMGDICHSCIAAKTAELLGWRTEIWTNIDGWFELNR